MKTCQRKFKEDVFVAENSQSQKTKFNGRNSFKLILHWLQSMEKQFSLEIALDIKRRFNKAISSYFFYLNCLYFHFISWW